MIDSYDLPGSAARATELIAIDQSGKGIGEIRAGIASRSDPQIEDTAALRPDGIFGGVSDTDFDTAEPCSSLRATLVG